MDLRIIFKIDEKVNFYFYLINLYSYEEDNFNKEFRRKHHNLRSKQFFKEFENMENPFIKDFLGINRIDSKAKELINQEKKNFMGVWSEMHKQALTIKNRLENEKGKIQEMFKKLIALTKINPKYEEYVINIVPELKHHGMQDNKNFIYLGVKKEMDIEDYKFVIIHELAHLLLYDFMNDYYFQYSYNKNIHIIEEILINFLYFKITDTAGKKILPRWLYLNSGECYKKYCELVEFESSIGKDLKMFVERSIKKLKCK